MKNQVDYFHKIFRILTVIKRDHPDVEITKHLMLATDGSVCNMTDKELYNCLMKHKSELDMNTLSDKDLQKVIDETEDLFTEVEDDEDWPDEDPVY